MLKVCFTQNWQATCDTDQVDAAIEKCDMFRRALTVNLEDKAGPLIESITKLSAWLNNFRSMAKPPIEEEKEVPASEEVPTPETQVEEQAVVQPIQSGVELEGVPLNSKLDELQLKIDAFQKLCKQGDFTRASIITEDLEYIMANFTPQEYFPQSFSQYFASLAINAAELSPHWQERGTLGWQALERLYQVDPESFLNLDL